MLGLIRKFSSSIWAKIFLIIVAIPFIFWGMGPVFQGGKINTIAEIGNEKISTDEFINYIKYDASRRYDGKIDEKLIEKLLIDFVGEKLIEFEIEELDIIISEKSLGELIKNEKIFKKNNEFSRTEYEKFLITNQINAVTFESNLKKQVKKDLLFDYISGGIIPSNFLVNIDYNKANQEREIVLINLNKVFEKKINISENEIESYFKKNKDSFLDEFRTIKYFKLNPKNLTGNNEFSNLYFNRIDEIDDFIVQGKKIDFILNKFNLENPATITFNSVAKNKLYKDIVAFPKKLADKVFSTPASEPVVLVEHENSYFIFEIYKVDTIQKDITNNFVRKEVISKLKKNKKRNLISKIINKINENKFKIKDFHELEKKENILSKKIKIKNHSDSTLLKEEIVHQIYKFPKNRVIIVADIGLEENYLVYTKNIKNASLSEKSDNYSKYLSSSKNNIKSKIYDSFDSYLNNKYKININQNALDKVKNYIE